MHTAQLMPLPRTVSCFSKIQIGFAFLVPAYLGSPGKGAVKRVCVCVCAAVSLPFTCDFEKDNICDMQLSSASNVDWTRRIGRASQQDTGPSGAQSGSYYMLMDSSMTSAPGHRAMSVADSLFTLARISVTWYF